MPTVFMPAASRIDGKPWRKKWMHAFSARRWPAVLSAQSSRCMRAATARPARTRLTSTGLNMWNLTRSDAPFQENIVTVTLTTTGLDIDGQHVPVYSGTIHYWRLERDLWPLILDRAKALGFNMIETYIPWSIHEIEPGLFDWGQIDPRKNVEAFMALCEEKRLWLLVRPGPLINAELTDFGFPEWVLLDPDVQARTAAG